MKTYIYLFLLLIATASCSEQTAPDHSVGYLRVENIILSCDTETLPITRAVDAGLKLEIWQGSECVYVVMIREQRNFPKGSFFRLVNIP